MPVLFLQIYPARIQRDDSDRKKIATVATAYYLVRVMRAMLKHGTLWKEQEPHLAASGDFTNNSEHDSHCDRSGIQLSSRRASWRTNAVPSYGSHHIFSPGEWCRMDAWKSRFRRAHDLDEDCFMDAGASYWCRVDYRPGELKRLGFPNRRGRFGPRLGGPLNSPLGVVGRRGALFGRRAEWFAGGPLSLKARRGWTTTAVCGSESLPLVARRFSVWPAL